MTKTDEKIDSLTGLNLRAHLYDNYNSYIEIHKGSNIIVIDFTKLKYINDNFGHVAGDKCIASFGQILRRCFEDSLLIRLGGDEFGVVTKYSEDEIKRKLEACYEMIATCFDDGLVPVKYSFNAGIAPCEENLSNTLRKADAIMYYAKMNKQLIQFYDEDIFLKAEENEQFVDRVKNIIKNDALTFDKQMIYGEGIKIEELYSRDEMGKSLFLNDGYNLLLRSYLFKDLDLLNFANFVRLSVLDGAEHDRMLNINGEILRPVDNNFIDLVSNVIESTGVKPGKLILSINRYGSSISTLELTDAIKKLRELGIQIGIDNFGNVEDPLGINLWSNAPINYLKINRTYWTEHTPKKETILRAMIPELINHGTLPIFSSVENEEEYQYIKGLHPRVLSKGKYHDRESILRGEGRDR